MTLIAFGINHNTASVEMREKVAFGDEQLVDALLSLQKQAKVDEAMILSTCNRTEIYASAEALSSQDLANWLSEFHRLDVNAVQTNSYTFCEDEAIRHVMRVASGLDSMVLGEPQILGQIKQAYASARNAGTVSSDLERLLQHTFSVAKRVRTETEIGSNAVSVAFAAVQLAKHIFSSLKKTSVLLIGAGETIELVARHLSEQGVQRVMVANRTLERAADIAAQFGGEGLTLQQIPAHLPDADIVISSTASQLPIIGKGMVEKALKSRRHKPMFLVDLAVPRDIESQVAELEDAFLYSVDDLQQIVEKNMASRESAAKEAEKIVNEQAQGFLQWARQQQHLDVLREFRSNAEQQRDKLKLRAMNQLAEGRSAEDVIDELSNKLTNTLIHPPTQAIKQAMDKRDTSLLQWLQEALGLSRD
ncbi:glutamyl-tRNA reductase [Aestuariibacter salexigens]|uniref:glutamyl-tRNA reductase n=1 Tax=Aestuariibacter salexigens TaxID=226010 RepID=UPI0003FE5E77|nr:glutamyl-tRNA reductase [Aestuariibacter salexigens]